MRKPGTNYHAQWNLVRAMGLGTCVLSKITFSLFKEQKYVELSLSGTIRGKGMKYK